MRSTFIMFYGSCAICCTSRNIFSSSPSKYRLWPILQLKTKVAVQIYIFVTCTIFFFCNINKLPHAMIHCPDPTKIYLSVFACPPHQICCYGTIWWGYQRWRESQIIPQNLQEWLLLGKFVHIVLNCCTEQVFMKSWHGGLDGDELVG